MTIRSLADWLTYLERLHPSTIDMGLERVRLVAARLGLKRPAARVITVTGTNGKGSTCAFLASLLRSQGLRVGVYSSPHLQRYNERVAVNGRMASDEALCEAFAAVEEARGETSLTYFEMGTLAAFWLFQAEALDAAVLEVGLGGRLDAVNLVDPDLSVITNIGLDHAEWLGDSRESVAREKAGILRPGVPAVCGDTDPPLALSAHAATLGAPLLVRRREFDLALSGGSWNWSGRDAEGAALKIDNLPLLGLPIENAALALQAFALLGLPWQPEGIGKALSETRVTGRLDRRSTIYEGRRVNLLMDVGHNPHAAHYLAGQLSRAGLKGRRLAVFGLLADKDLGGVLQPLLPLVDQWVVATLGSSRARPAEELARAIALEGAPVEASADVAAALEIGARMAGPDDEILVFGSFYCVAECLDWLERTPGETIDGVAG